MITNIIRIHCTVGRRLLEEFEGDDKTYVAALVILASLILLFVRIYLENKKKR